MYTNVITYTMKIFHNLDEQQFVQYNNALFKKVAPYYRLLDFIITGIRGKFVSFLSPSKSSMVLDIATGTGKQAEAFARVGCNVVGIDLSEDMLAYAKNNKYPNATFMVANGTSLPFAEGSFDLTVMSFALHCMTLDIRQKVIKEMKRVSKANGQLAFVDYALPDHALGRQVIYRLVSLYETKLYKEFIHSDFLALLRRQGIKIETHKKYCLGAIQMIHCRLL